MSRLLGSGKGLRNRKGSANKYLGVLIFTKCGVWESLATNTRQYHDKFRVSLKSVTHFL